MLALIAIVGGFAATRFVDLSARSYANDVRVLVQRARFESVNRNVPVSVQWEEDEQRFVALLGEPTDACGGDEIIVGRPTSEYRNVSVTFESTPPPVLVWIPSGLAKSCDFSVFPGTIARATTDGGPTFVVTVSLTGKVTVEQ